MESVRILIVDDEELVRSGLRLLLDGVEGIAIVGEAAEGATALRLVAEANPDVILLDLRMPGMGGLECAQQLLQRDPNSTVLILTTFDSDETVIRALEIGASGFLLKDTSPAELISAVRQAASGSPVLSPSVTRQLIRKSTAVRRDQEVEKAQRKLALLTEREQEIAVAVAQGLSNQRISEQHYISMATVKTHVARVMMKLQAENRVQISLYVYRAGLL